MNAKPRVGISSCLLGENVRYDGGNKRQTLLLEAFAGQVEWVPVCPELEFGLGVPRPRIRLEDRGAGGRLVVIESRADLTEEFDDWSARSLDELDGLAGYVFKARSPSCGVGTTPVFSEQGEELRRASGAFAQAFAERFPLIPTADEEDLADAAGRARFLDQVRTRPVRP